MLGFISELSILSHWSKCLFSNCYHIVLIELSKCDAFSFVLTQDCLSYLGSCGLHVNCSSFVKNVIGILIEIALNLYTARYVHFSNYNTSNS